MFFVVSLTSLACVVLCSGSENACFFIVAYIYCTWRTCCLFTVYTVDTAVLWNWCVPLACEAATSIAWTLSVCLELLAGRLFARLVCPVYISTFLMCICVWLCSVPCWVSRCINVTCSVYSVSKKSSPLKLFATFSLKLSIFPWNFADLLPVYVHIYVAVLVDLS